MRLAALLAVAASAAAPAPAPFDFKDPKGVNSIHWTIDSPLEPIQGTAHGIEGEVKYDPEHPEKSSGTIRIPVAQMVAPVAMMSDHLKSDKWLDAAKYPTIEFRVKSVLPGERAAESLGATVVGDLTMHGVTKEIEAPVEVRLVPGGLGARMGGRMKGDVFRLRTEFRIKRSDFGVGPQIPSVGDEVELRVAIVGIRPEA